MPIEAFNIFMGIIAMGCAALVLYAAYARRRIEELRRLQERERMQQRNP